MACKRVEGTFSSSSGLCDIFYRAWMTSKPAKAAVQIVHGMAEYGERYEDFAAALCEAGYDVWAMDLLGHGKSVASEEDYGYFGEKHGWKKVIADIRQMTNIMREQYPEGFPLFLFGHSMGSFYARAYCERFSEDLAGGIFCGTSAPNPATAAGAFMAKIIATFRGDKYQSQYMNDMAFGQYNKRFAPARTAFDWLNTDAGEVDKYVADPLCGFIFTTKGFLDLFTLLKSVSDKNWFTSMPYQFPTFLIAGDQDPVGSFGSGVELVARRMREAGSNRTTCTIFHGMRHEILLEPEHALVYEAILEWMNGVLDPQKD